MIELTDTHEYAFCCRNRGYCAEDRILIAATDSSIILLLLIQEWVGFFATARTLLCVVSFLDFYVGKLGNSPDSASTNTGFRCARSLNSRNYQGPKGSNGYKYVTEALFCEKSVVYLYIIQNNRPIFEIMTLTRYQKQNPQQQRQRQQHGGGAPAGMDQVNFAISTLLLKNTYVA